MPSFTDVVAGNPTLASDLNQIVDRLNGTVNAGVIVAGGASAFVPYTGQLSAAPGAGSSPIYAALVSGDTKNRADLSIRSDGYGMLEIGAGTSIVGNLYGVSSGLKTDQSLMVVGALTAQGTTTLAGFTASGTGTVSGAFSLGSTISMDAGLITTNGSGLLSWHNTLSANNKLADFQQGYGLYSDNTGAFAGTSRLWFDVPSGSEMHFGGRSGSAITSTRFISQLLMIDAQSSIAWPYLEGRNGTGGSGLRIVGAGTVIARFQTGSTSLIINNGYQFGSGGADMAELYWSDDPSLEPGDVVCCVEDAASGGKIIPCSKDNYPAAFIISTAPASIHGGQLIELEEDGKTIQEPDPDPRWKPVALNGRVPVKVTGDLSQYTAGETFLVSSADGKARPAREGEKARWLCVSKLSDVGKRPLAPGSVLAQLL